MIIYKDIEGKETEYEHDLSDSEIRQLTKWREKEEEIKNEQKKLQEAEERLANGLEDWQIKSEAITEAITMLKKEFVRLEHKNKEKIVCFAAELTKLMNVYELTLDCICEGYDQGLSITKLAPGVKLHCYIQEQDNIYDKEPFNIGWGAAD